MDNRILVSPVAVIGNPNFGDEARFGLLSAGRRAQYEKNQKDECVFQLFFRAVPFRSFLERFFFDLQTLRLLGFEQVETHR